MNPSENQTCQQEINCILQKGHIDPSKSVWACREFYINKCSKKKRGKPRLVVEYKPLNKVLYDIRHPLPNKRSLLQKIEGMKLFNNFDLKSGLYQIDIFPEVHHNTTFVGPHGHYQWKLMPFS